MSLEARKAPLEAQRLLTAYQASDEAAVAACVDALRKVGVHQESAFFSTRNYDLAQLTRALDALRRAGGRAGLCRRRSGARSRRPTTTCGTRCGSASRRRRRSDARWEAVAAALVDDVLATLHLQSRTPRPRP